MRLTLNVRAIKELYGDETTARLVKAAGFEAVDYSLMDMTSPDNIFLTDSYVDEAQRIRSAYESAGLAIAQTHAPFSFSNWEDPEYFEGFIMPSTKRAVEVSGLLGADTVVVHPLNYMPYSGNEERLFEINMRFYRELIPIAEKYGVKIAVENLFEWYHGEDRFTHTTCSSTKEFVRYVDSLDSEYAVACLDVGHAKLPLGSEENAWDFVRALGHDRLRALHIHDNDLIKDQHLLPYMGSIDWDKVTEALGEIDYAGDFTYEVDFGYVDRIKKYGDIELMEIELAYMAGIGRLLVNKIERSRNKS